MSELNVATLRTPTVQSLLGRAAVYELLSCAFSYPDAESVEQLQAYIRDIAEHPIADGLELGPLLSALEHELEGTPLRSLETGHTGLFAGDVQCSPHETEYDFDTFVKARQLADIAGFYRAFGLKPAGPKREAPDFVATELEFLSIVTLKQAYANVQGWEDEATVAADALRAFVQDHAGRWIPTLCRSIAETQGASPFYLAAAALCARVFEREIQRLGVSPNYAAPRRLGRSERETFTCGLATAAETEEE
jgi:putative dimethyl sulfoxide reductase chaperone